MLIKAQDKIVILFNGRVCGRSQQTSHFVTVLIATIGSGFYSKNKKAVCSTQSRRTPQQSESLGPFSRKLAETAMTSPVTCKNY